MRKYNFSLPTNRIPFLSSLLAGRSRGADGAGEYSLLPSPSTPSTPSTRIRAHGSRQHRRQLSLSSFGPKRLIQLFSVLFVVVVLVACWAWIGDGFSLSRFTRGGKEYDFGYGAEGIPLGQSRERGREVFWWEGFKDLRGYYIGWKDLIRKEDWRSEQDGGLLGNNNEEAEDREGDGDDAEVGVRDGLGMRRLDMQGAGKRRTCYINEERRIEVPVWSAHEGIPRGFPAPLFGSISELGIQDDVCYDRINRFSPYGYGFADEEGGLGINAEGDTDEKDAVNTTDFRGVNWNDAQRRCILKNGDQPRTAFIIRTWHNFEYTPFHIMMLRAIVSELSLTSGGRYQVHFLIHVQNDSLPIWASEQIYNQTLKESLPEEFAGMGTLWSVAQMKLIYPPPFPESIVNFSGDDIYKAYRSLHFPLQYFATKHPEFDYFWHWEMDLRITGHYLELLDRISEWADEQPREQAWERGEKFFVPSLYEGRGQSSYEAYSDSINAEIASSTKSAISGPQLPNSELLTPIDGHPYPNDNSKVDLITINPLFDPNNTLWAFHEDITGYYNNTHRPPTRASLITTTRLSRRLLLTMHHETFQNKHTMFPEMYPASIALHYGYSAVAAPLPIYFDHDWPPFHADIVFNNAPIPADSLEAKAGMGSGRFKGHFHGVGGSVFGPGEHVFRGASYYSNAGFAGYLWRRWMGRENGLGELAWEVDPPETEEEKRMGRGSGRMCLPMMILHPIKFE